MRWVPVWVLLLVLGACSDDGPAPREVVVFAAASLTDVMEDAAEDFKRAYPDQQLILSVGGTSLLARQIAQGAPADVFLSANRAWVDHLASLGRTEGPPYTIAGNRLVIAGGPDQPPLVGLDRIGRFKSIALADPDHVPAGIYAKEALECAGLWESVAPRIIPMLDVRTALLATVTGAAEVAIVYASDIKAAPRARVVLEWPQSCAPEIQYVAARIRGGSNPAGASAFLDFVTDTSRASLWERHGLYR